MRGRWREKQVVVRPPPARTPLSVGGLGKTRDRQSDLDRSPNTLDSRSEVIQPPGQTAQKKQAKLLAKSRRAMALRAHLQELVV